MEKERPSLCVWLSSEWFPLKEVSVGSSAGKGESPNTEVKDGVSLWGTGAIQRSWPRQGYPFGSWGSYLERAAKGIFFFFGRREKTLKLY